VWRTRTRGSPAPRVGVVEGIARHLGEEARDRNGERDDRHDERRRVVAGARRREPAERRREEHDHDGPEPELRRDARDDLGSPNDRADDAARAPTDDRLEQRAEEREDPGGGEREHGEQRRRSDLLADQLGHGTMLRERFAEIKGRDVAQLQQILHEEGLIEPVLRDRGLNGLLACLRARPAEHGLQGIPGHPHGEEHDGRDEPDHENRGSELRRDPSCDARGRGHFVSAALISVGVLIVAIGTTPSTPFVR
jgi:hypothetical protein